MSAGEKVWIDGSIVNYGDAKLPMLTHSIQYGSAVFEGIRAYDTERGTAVFRLDAHMGRFLQTAKICSMPMPYSKKELSDAVLNIVRLNGSKPCYIRPFAFYNDDRIGVSVVGKNVSVAIATVEMGAYLKRDPNKGISCKVSSWRRIDSAHMPVKAKASGNYLNSIMANSEAKGLGYDEAILLSGDGHVAEGTGENIFVVRDNALVTPDIGSDILDGITRDSVIKISESIGVEIKERALHREELYSADEVFLTGTAVEIIPVSNVDGVKIGEGSIGPITKLLSDKYFSVVHGREREFEAWLEYV